MQNIKDYEHAYGALQMKHGTLLRFQKIERNKISFVSVC